MKITTLNPFLNCRMVNCSLTRWGSLLVFLLCPTTSTSSVSVDSTWRLHPPARYVCIRPTDYIHRLGLCLVKTVRPQGGATSTNLACVDSTWWLHPQPGYKRTGLSWPHPLVRHVWVVLADYIYNPWVIVWIGMADNIQKLGIFGRKSWLHQQPWNV
jgi:hypothetical protein